MAAIHFARGRARLSRIAEAWRGKFTEASMTLAALEAKAQQERTSADEKIRLLTEARGEMTAEFRALAGQVIREHGDDFKKTAKEQLVGIVAPLRDNIGRFEGEMRTARENAAKENAALKQQLSTLTQQSAAVSKEAENLTKALRGDTQRQGAWGEAILSRLLELSGLEEGREYRSQVSERNAEGRSLRPDVVVDLPGERQLVIDSKVSLVAYEQVVTTEDDTEREEALRRHIQSLQSHIKGLSSKEYETVTKGSLDYVIMFVPIEGALSEALRAKGDLTEFALERNVMIATPTTLMMALRTIKSVWDVDRRTRNADEIAERAGRLYEKIAGFATDMETVGKQLDKARETHGQAVAKLSTGRGNVIGQVEKLKTLGAKTIKSIPETMRLQSGDD